MIFFIFFIGKFMPFFPYTFFQLNLQNFFLFFQISNTKMTPLVYIYKLDKHCPCYYRRYEIEEKMNNACSDYINFYEGTSTTPLNTDPYCGSVAPSNITSSGSSLTVLFVTDSTVTRRGFDLLFTAFSQGKAMLV